MIDLRLLPDISPWDDSCDKRHIARHIVLMSGADDRDRRYSDIPDWSNNHANPTKCNEMQHHAI